LPTKPRKQTTYWSRIRKKAPKVPDITCPDIDKVLDIIDKAQARYSPLTKAKHKQVERIMEKLRTANDSLRESGKYWHDACKDTVRDLLGKRKMR
jgi:4-hydroxy-3-methylbut-2-enyl diphosphate reductase IspH